MLLTILDSDGVARRKARRMKRRVYQNKVGNVQRVATIINFKFFNFNFYYRFRYNNSSNNNH